MSIDERIEALTRRLKQLNTVEAVTSWAVMAADIREDRTQDCELIQALLRASELQEQQLQNRRLPGH